ncbi:MAG: hypothetical protein F6K30_18455 [Cyanothece sp. SIO2G6]|nr:hypothetical protein [Cyanothece sp. SIO2G6]
MSRVELYFEILVVMFERKRVWEKWRSLIQRLAILPGTTWFKNVKFHLSEQYKQEIQQFIDQSMYSCRHFS